MMDSPKEWEKYATIYAHTLKNFLADRFFKPEFMEAGGETPFYIEEILQDSKGDFVFRFKRTMRLK